MADFIRVRELREGDRVLAGNLLGAVKTVEDLVVKNVVPGDQNKYALTFFRLGTIFVHGDALVSAFLNAEAD